MDIEILLEPEMLGKVPNDITVIEIEESNSENRIIVYKNVNDSLVAYRNKGYVKTLLSRCDMVINYLIGFCSFTTVLESVRIRFSEFSIKMSECTQRYTLWRKILKRVLNITLPWI